MKKRSKSAWKRSQRSSLKKASLVKKHLSFHSKKFAGKQKDRETKVKVCNVPYPINKVLRKGALISPRLPCADLDDPDVMEMTPHDIRELRRLGYKLQICSYCGFGGDSSGGCGDFDGNFDGGSEPNGCASEKKFLVMVLEYDEQRRKKLEEILAGLKEQDAKILKRLHEITVNEAQDDIEPNPKKKVFRRDIKDTMMAEAMYDVYEKIFGDEAKKKHENYDFSPIDLIAYLFIMVDIHQYGRPDFHYNGKRPFFEFFIENVKPELKGKRGITRETMGNRINKVFDCLYLTSEAKEKQTAKTRSLNKRIEDNYQTICGKFHKTRLGGILQKHK